VLLVILLLLLLLLLLLVSYWMYTVVSSKYEYVTGSKSVVVCQLQATATSWVVRSTILYSHCTLSLLSARYLADRFTAAASWLPTASSYLLLLLTTASSPLLFTASSHPLHPLAHCILTGVEGALHPV
jgi:hypothetical protein